MDETRLKDELLARLSFDVDRETLHLIEGALSAVLRDYEVSHRNTELSTEVVTWPEFEIFMGKMVFGGYSKSTIRQYGTFLRELLVYVGKPVREITSDDIMAFINKYAAERMISGSTKNHKRLICSSFFSFLHDRGYIPQNPMATIDPIKYVAEVREALSPREVEKLRIACGANVRDNVVLELFLATGCRVSEIAGMRVENIDLDAGSVKVLGKGNKERIVFINDRAMEYLERYLAGRKTGSVILSVRAPHQGIKKNAIENIIKSIAGRSGIGRSVFPHLLRHTFATHALNKGMPLPSLCDLMGHASIDTTRIYDKNTRGKLKYEYDMYVA